MSALIPIDDRFERLVDALEDPAERASFESLLPGYLRAQRWFGGAARTISTATVTAWADLGLEDADAVLCVVTAADASGLETVHQLYLGIFDDDTGPPVVLDALDQSAVREGLAALVVSGGVVEGHGLRLIGEPEPGEPVRPGTGSRVLEGEQTNTTLLFDDVCMAKVYRQLRGGTNPDVELLHALTEAGFAAVPAYLGRARLTVDDADMEADAVLLERFVHNEGNGWDWALRHARTQIEAAAAGDDLSHVMAADGTVDRLRLLGQLTAELHAALNGLTGDNLASRSGDAADVDAIADALQAEAARTADVVRRTGFTASGLDHALAQAGRIESAAISGIGRLTRIHGDYHLGQLLVDASGFTVIDFEGEPARPLEERRALQHPLVDVAGMLRSFDYAGQTARKEADAEPALGAVWTALAREAFLEGYWAAAAGAPFLPAEAPSRDRLLALLELRKALYELRYELEYRPAWAEIPASAIPALAERL